MMRKKRVLKFVQIISHHPLLPQTWANTGTRVAWLAARTIDKTITATAVKLARVTESRHMSNLLELEIKKRL